MKGTAARSVLPWATFCRELVRVWFSATWKLATPAAEASSARVMTAVWGAAPALAVSAVRLCWALAETAKAIAAARADSASLPDMIPPCVAG